MSTVIMAICWPLRMPPSPKAVLISLADNANDAGVCWPSIAKICERTCLGKTAVIEAIKWLESAGLLSADRTNGRHTTYQIELQAIQQGALFEQTGPVRLPDRSASRTGPAAGPNRSASRTAPVRQADTNRQEPSRTVRGEPRSPSGSRLPLDWSPSDEDLAFARRERPEVDAMAEAAKFRDYWHAVAGAKGRRADWHATWRNWIRRADAPKAAPGQPVPGSAAPKAPARDWREPSESRLQTEIAHIQQLHSYGALGDGPEADAERDRRIADARRKHSNPTQEQPSA